MGRLVRAVAVESGVRRLAVRVRPTNDAHRIVVAYPWAHRERAQRPFLQNREALTAAHRTLPLGTKVKVTNKSNGNSVVVTINDRGPFVRGRIIDVSPGAARVLGFSGLTHVTVNGE